MGTKLGPRPGSQTSRVLEILEANPTMTPQNACRQAGIRTPSITTILKRLGIKPIPQPRGFPPNPNSRVNQAIKLYLESRTSPKMTVNEAARRVGIKPMSLRCTLKRLGIRPKLRRLKRVEEAVRLYQSAIPQLTIREVRNLFPSLTKKAIRAALDRPVQSRVAFPLVRPRVKWTDPYRRRAKQSSDRRRALSMW